MSSQYVWSEHDFLEGERYRFAFKPGRNLILNSKIFFSKSYFSSSFYVLTGNCILFCLLFLSHFVRNKAEGRISKRVFQENKASQIFPRMCAHQGVRNVSFSENFVCLLFLKIPVLRFVLLPYYRRLIWSHKPSPFHLSLFCKKRAFKFQIYWSLTMCYMSI